jgi:hypothetical protein
VPGVDNSTEVDRAGSRLDLDADLERARDRPNRVELDLAQTTTLRALHRGPRHTRPVREVLLPPGAPDPGHSDQPPEPDVVHGGQHRSGRLPAGYADLTNRTDVRYARRTSTALGRHSDDQVDNRTGRVDNRRDIVDEPLRTVDEEPRSVG